jgi:replicative DNA helicase
MKHISEILDKLFDQIDYLQQHRGQVLGVATGFSDLDHLTAGLQPSDLVVIAAPESMGKTSLALGMAYGAAIGHHRSVGFISSEMSVEQLVQRLLSMETGVDTRRLRLGQINDDEWDRISRAFGRLSEAPIYLDAFTYLTLEELRANTRNLQSEHGLDMIVIDDLELLRMSSSRNTFEDKSEIVRSLKRLARELGVPIVVTAQISGNIDRHLSYRPILSDLRDKGSLEEDADLVIFIYREDQYDADSEKRGHAEIIVAKHRNGPVGTVNLRFFERTGRFADLELYAATPGW